MKDQKSSEQSLLTTKERSSIIYSVVGPTASGKTEKAFQLGLALLKGDMVGLTSFGVTVHQDFQTTSDSKVIGVNLISVDSRQVYRGLEVVTGADVPNEFKLAQGSSFSYPFFSHQHWPINLHGISMIEVTDDWSVSHFMRLAIKIIDWSVKNHWAVILVGGTGLYHRQLKWFLAGKEIISVPPNDSVRKKATKMSVNQLQNWLCQLDVKKLKQLNQSDKNNPRRLIRAIEIALTKGEKIQKQRLISVLADIRNVSLKNIHWQEIRIFPDNLRELKTKIRQRVIKRLDQGAVAEVKELLKLGLPSQNQVMTTLGVPEIIDFLSGSLTKTELINLWTLHEFQYAKRQLTWWSKVANFT